MLPLDTLREQISYHPWHFWGWQNSSIVPVSECNTVVQEYGYQGADAVGRNEMRRAINIAHARLREHLNYSIGRRWVTETVQHPRPKAYGQQFISPVGGQGRWLNQRLTEGYVRAIGVEAFDILDANTTVVYSDPDGDGLNELFTLSIAGVDSNLNVDEVEVYFIQSDRLNSDPERSYRWRIAPIEASLSGTTLTIKGRAWMLGKPILYQHYTINRDGIDPSDSNNFVSELEVVRHYTDPTGTTTDTSQAKFVWETEPYPVWACGTGSGINYIDNSADPSALGFAIARVGIRDAMIGNVYFGQAIYNTTNDQWERVSYGNCRQPDRIEIRYECGARLGALGSNPTPTNNDARWEEVITRLALAKLARRICACDVANHEIYRWQEDWGMQEGARSYTVSPNNLANPLGTRAGQIYAWNIIKNMLNVPAYLPG